MKCKSGSHHEKFQKPRDILINLTLKVVRHQEKATAIDSKLYPEMFCHHFWDTVQGRDASGWRDETAQLRYTIQL